MLFPSTQSNSVATLWFICIWTEESWKSIPPTLFFGHFLTFHPFVFPSPPHFPSPPFLIFINWIFFLKKKMDQIWNQGTPTWDVNPPTWSRLPEDSFWLMTIIWARKQNSLNKLPHLAAKKLGLNCGHKPRTLWSFDSGAVVALCKPEKMFYCWQSLLRLFPV